MILEDTFSEAEIAFIQDTNVIFEDENVQGLSVEVDEDLVTDYIMIAGYTTTEAYAAAERVARYDQTSF